MIAPPTGRPAGPPPQPVFATTGNARADSVLATLDATIAPFMSAPPPEQGAAGWVAQGLGGALGVINAPMMFIDAAASQGVSAILDALGLSGLFPPMPVATIGLSMHIGTPHTHVHPPSLVPPAPPIPLPSMGVAFLAGSASVLVGGVPALRAGDIGIGFTCGSMAPPFEIMTGASGVYFAGARVARFGMDITFHCNPASPMGAFAIGMGVAGVVAGAAGAAAQASAGNSGAAIAQGIQAGLDAAAMAVGMLRGKDPAGPPGIGMLIGPPMGNVLAGGPPIPNIGALAQGKIYQALGRALRAMRGRLRRRTPPPDANGRACDAGEPVHVVTGANYNTYLDFASLLGGFEFERHCSSADASSAGVLGHGWRHVFETRLEIRLHRVTMHAFEGEQIAFPRLRGENEVAMHGYRLRRVSDDLFSVSHRRLGRLDFRRDGRGSGVARLVAVQRDGIEVQLRYDRHRRVEGVTERRLGGGREATASYTLRYDTAGHLAEIWGSRFSEPDALLVRYEFGDRGDLLRVEDGRGASETFTYDALHRIVEATDRVGYVFRWSYDHEGRCVETVGADGLWAARLAYEPGQTTVTIHDGARYVYRYDEDGVITEIEGPCGGVKKRIRDPESGEIVGEVEAGGEPTSFVYDQDGGLVARRNRFGHRYPPSIDAPGVPNTLARHLPDDARGFLLGHLVDERTPQPPPLEVRRDLRGNVVYERDARGHERRWSFDAAGNPISRTDRDGRTYRTPVTSWGLQGAEIDPLGNTVEFEHNPHQKITRVIDGGGTESRYVYDSHDRVIEVHRAGRLHERYVWDDGHHLVEKLDGEGQSLLRLEPHDNGLTGRIIRGDGGCCVFDYDRHGKITKADTADHVVERGWTAFEELHFEDCDGRVIEHVYDWRGEQATLIAGKFLSRRERVGDRIRLIDPTGAVREIRRERDGSVEIDHGNGTIEAQTYDAEGRLLSRACSRPRPNDAERVHWAVRYEYSAEGDLLGTRDTVRGETRYEVDAAHRLVGVTRPDGAKAQYRYDAASNLVDNPSVGTIRIDRGNRLHSAAAERFEYDERGRIGARVDVSGSEVRYHYDDEDQLVRIEDAEGEPWTATYDALGRRITYGRGPAKTLLWWDGDRVAARQAPDGSLRIFQFADNDSLVPIGFVDYDDISAAPESGRRYTVFSDQVGLPKHIEDQRGKIVWWADYTTPYGEVFVRPGNEIEYEPRFVGQIADPEARLHYNRFRDYDPRLGRYLQLDPLGIRGSVNLYAYPSNPVVGVDILGLAHKPRDGDAPHDSDGESRPRGDDPNEGADARPPRMSRAEADQMAADAAAKHRAELAARTDADWAARGYAEGERPACVGAVVDRVTGHVEVSENLPRGVAAVPEDFHPLLQDRVRRQQSRREQVGQGDHFSEPGTHAEVRALDAALKARDQARADAIARGDPNPPPAPTHDTLGDFYQRPEWNRPIGERQPGDWAPCCGHCAPITHGVTKGSSTTRGTDRSTGEPLPQDADPFVRTGPGERDWARRPPDS